MEMPSPMVARDAPLPDDPFEARRVAVSRVLAADLAGWEEVRDFRRASLGGRLLDWEEVAGWVFAQSDAPPDGDGPPSYWLSDVPVSEEQVRRGTQTAQEGFTAVGPFTVPLPFRRNGLPGRLERRLVEYLVPDVGRGGAAA